MASIALIPVLQGLLNRLPEDNPGRLSFERHLVKLTLNRTFTVERLAVGVITLPSNPPDSY